MTMNRFAHANAFSIGEVVEVLDEGCRPLAGGTELLGLMKGRLIAPDKLVNLKTIPGLDQVEERGDGWHIGATTPLSRIAAVLSTGQHKDVACLHDAIERSASPQLRHVATIGGNLVQRPRCWYYRDLLIPCWRKGGQRCFAFRGENKYHVILGGGPCYAVHPSDPAVALLALDALVLLVGRTGQRSVPLADFYRLPTRESRGDTMLAVDELIAEVLIRDPAANSRGTYVKVAERGSWDFALASAAVQLAFAGGRVAKARVVLGGVAPVPWRALEAENELVGKALSPDVIERAALAATAGARPLEHNGYKVDLAQGTVRQALRDLR